MLFRSAQALKDTVAELKKRGKTVIFSTHLMDNAERLCDSVCIIARGEKVLDGTVSGVKAAHGGNNVALAVGAGGTETLTRLLAEHALIAKVDDSNRFFEIRMQDGADPQSLLRTIVAAEPGHTFVRADLGQIEPRVLAAVSGDPVLRQATRDDDLYQPVAARLGVERSVEIGRAHV